MRNAVRHFLGGVVVLVMGCSNSEEFCGILDIDKGVVNEDLETASTALASGDLANEVVVDTNVIDTVLIDANRYLDVRPGRLLPDAGFYEPFMLRFPTPHFGGVVRCTFDGSAPLPDSSSFENNVFIDKTTTVRCTEFRGTWPVATSTETYFIGEDIDMPVLSISAAPSYVENYIKAEPCTPNPCASATFWEDVEYPAHVEFFDKGSRSDNKAFEIDAGLSIAGGWSRNNLKKSLSITMRKEYQEGRIFFPLFSTRPQNNTFKAIKLRNNGNRNKSDYICDPMATSLLEGTHVDYQRSRQVVCFFNGEFYGIYDMREKLNEHFVETNYGISNNRVEVIEQVNADVSAIHGRADGFEQMLQYAATNDLNDSAAYEEIWKMVDMENYVDYMAAEMYYHNGDWPQNNVKAWRTIDGPWRFMAYDVDHGFDWNSPVTGFNRKTNILKWVLGGGRPDRVCSSGDPQCFSNLFVELFKNPDFRRLFINRSVVFFAEYINSQKVADAVDKMVASIDTGVIARDLEKFPRKKYSNQCGEGFDPNGSCIKRWSVARDSIVREEFRSVLELGRDVNLTFETQGNGKIRMEYFDLPNSNYTAKFYANHPILLTAIPNNDFEVFDSWEDGSVENPRLVMPANDSIFVAKFKIAE